MGKRLTASQRRALAILADADTLNGCNLEILLANGFKVVRVSRLVRAALASLTRERVRAGCKAVEVAHVRITDAGREVLGR
jgi:hypothetical protein